MEGGIMFLSHANFPHSLDKAGREVYDALKEGKYELYYRYEREKEHLTYFAYLKEKSELPPFIVASLNASGHLIHLSDGYYFRKSHVNALLLFLEEGEKKLSEETLKAYYGEDYPVLKRLSCLDLEEFQAHEDHREHFLHFVKDLELPPSLIKEEKEKLPLATIDFSFAPANLEQTHCFQVSFTIHQGEKEIKVTAGRSYFLSVLTGEEFTYRGQKVPNRKEEFLPPYDALLIDIAKAALAFSRKVPFVNNYSSLIIDRESFVDILFALVGKKVTVEYLRPIEEVIPPAANAYIGFDEEANLIREPASFSKIPHQIYQSKEKVVLVENHHLRLFSFPSKNNASLYLFFLKEGLDSYFDVQDLFPKYVIPLAGKDLVTHPSFKEKSPYKITYQIIYKKEEDEIIYKSIYSQRGKEVSKDEFSSSFLGASLLSAFENALSEKGLKEDGVSEDPSLFLLQDLSSIASLAYLEIDDSLKRLIVKKDLSIKITSHLEGHYLRLTLHSNDFTYEELDKILEGFHKNKRYILLENRALIYTEKVKSTLSLIEEYGFLEKESPLLPFYEAYSLRTRGNDLFTFEDDGSLEKALQDVASFSSYPLSLSSALSSALRDYQKSAIQWLSVCYSYGFCPILADDMGLGKTLETIAFISTLKVNKPLLIVSPKSLVYNWANEFKRWYKDKKVVIVDGPHQVREELLSQMKEDDSIYLLSYDSLRIHHDFLKEKNFSLLVLDEGQTIKNDHTKKAQAAKDLNAEYRIVLTGTPIENNATDLWSIFDFLMPGYLGTKNEFLRMYEDSLLSKKIEILVRPFVLRRRKEDVLSSLPPKTILQVPVHLDEKERKIYESYLYKAREMRQEVGPIAILQMLTRLRQICIDPSTFLEGFEEPSSKLSLAMIIIQNNVSTGHKVLVFSSFTKVLDHLKPLLEEAEIPYATITGDTGALERVKLAENFNKKDEIKVMLISLKAGGTGLNLQGADTVIHLDPWWNLAAEEQASDRAHRIGQVHPVTIYKLITEDSVEEKVVLLQEKKKEIYERFIKSGEEGVSSLSKEDIAFILS